MNININETEKIVEIWVFNSQKYNDDLRNKLKPMFDEYKTKKYTVAMFFSGECDLIEKTIDLLKYNKAIAAI